VTASELATRLEAKLAGDGWVTRCPAHDDHRASLSIGTGDDGRILVKCHAGCTVEAITTAANLTTADLFTRPKKTATKKKIVATYAYEDEHNQALYEAVRFEPKSFRQRRPDGKGGWLWNMKGVRRVVYHLPDIRVRLSDPECITHRREHNLVDDVFVVEGEKDVDRLWRQGFVATTSVGGAGKWCDDYAQQLVTAARRVLSSFRITMMPGASTPRAWPGAALRQA
jgi:putative DNA primase/helicase